MLNCFPEWLHYFTHPATVCENSSCPASSPTLGIVGLFNLHSFMLTVFSHASLSPVHFIVFGVVFIQIFRPFVNLNGCFPIEF